ncbi:aldehyde dehydrogenase [Streptomyces sp. PRh5]|uniref:aldehyde dehydrogenase family protein n=1 Tax=Streptomyces sp. PRh5 TaxID=1158056 RepID=UPI00044B7BBE|nr:aldehyde dehydrogenase family protein [Streptomyces sp. PRh5]EXU62038.1 aldehyde dehydrogenase [Streptomyces sp. PRh5]
MTDIVSVNPAHPLLEIARMPASSTQEVDEAARRGAEAQRDWARLPASERGRALMAFADRLSSEAESLASLICDEVGKPIGEARAEVVRSVDILRYYAGLAMLPDGETLPSSTARGWLLSRRYPVGVIGMITPWNFPLAIPTWKAAPALAYGNAVLLKPASSAIGVARRFAAAAQESLPDGILHMLTGERDVAEAIIDHASVSAVSFTGSTVVGRSVAARAGARGAAVQCEMGGQNPSVVLRDADMEQAASTIATAITGYAGQKCTATSRVIVEDPLGDAFVDLLADRLKALKVGDPALPGTEVGPLIDAAARQSVLAAVASSSGRTITGGTAVDGLEGFYVTPTLVDVSSSRDVLIEQEVFGPVAAVVRARSREEALGLANYGTYGLVASVFTSDLEAAMTFCDELQVGMVKINAPTSGADFHAPFGGSRASALGPHEQGLAAREFFTQRRTLTLA